MNKLKHLLALFSLILFSNFLWAQLPYIEDFSGEIGKGVLGGPVTYDTSSVGWVIDVSLATLSATDDYFKVNSSSQFESKDVDAEVVWYSSLVDISSVSHVDLSVDVSHTGSMASTEYIKVYYKLDGGVETEFPIFGDNSSDFANRTA